MESGEAWIVVMFRAAYAEPPLFEPVMVWFVVPTWSGIPDMEPSCPSVSPDGRGGSHTHWSGSPPEEEGVSMWHDSPMVQFISGDLSCTEMTGIGRTAIWILKDAIPAAFDAIIV